MTTILRGPADADHFRIKVGRYGDRFYCDPLPSCDIAPATEDSWPSVSIVKKASGSDWSFVALKRVAQADLSSIVAKPFDERYEALKTVNKLGLNRAMQRGTNVHRFFEAGLYNGNVAVDPLFPDEPGVDYLPAVRAFFDTYQPELVAAEMVCINRTVGYGGTADALVKIDGKSYWVDWKSRGEDSAHGAYPEEAAQVGAGACAEYMIVEGPDGPVRQLIPELDGGLIVSVKPDGCRIYPVDLDKAFDHWHNLHLWWRARRLEREPVGKPWAPRKIAAVEPCGTGSGDEGGEASTPSPPNHFDAAALDRANKRAWLIGRVKALDDTGRKVLAAQWPDSVPTFKQSSEHTEQQLAWIEQAIVKAEAEVEAPFNPEPAPFKSRHTPADPFDGLSGEAWDEGGEVDMADADALKDLLEAEPAVKATVEAWAKQCNQDGNRSLSLKQKRTRWRHAVVSALLHAARAGCDDDGLRDLIYGATGDLIYLDVGGLPIGHVIANLTIVEADRVAHLARHLGTDALILTFSPDGTPTFGGTAYDPPPAA